VAQGPIIPMLVTIWQSPDLIFLTCEGISSRNNICIKYNKAAALFAERFEISDRF